jgi:hypothetical protein
VRIVCTATTLWDAALGINASNSAILPLLSHFGRNLAIFSRKEWWKRKEKKRKEEKGRRKEEKEKSGRKEGERFLFAHFYGFTSSTSKNASSNEKGSLILCFPLRTLPPPVINIFLKNMHP